jgi:uncharacterized membrane protein
VAKTATRARAKFQGPEPISTRPEDRIAERTAQRRAELAASRPRLFGLHRPSPMMGAILFIALVGFLIAAYTTAVHYVGPSLLACSAAKGHESSCEQVQFSLYNNVAGIPVAVLGLIGYFGIFASLRVRGEVGRAAGFGIALVGFLFSLYLTYREAFTLHEYCEWCLGSATCMTLLTILLGIRFLRADPLS